MATYSYGRQCIDERDIDAVIQVLRGDFLTQGPILERFEEHLCEYTGAKYAVAVANGTAALHLAMLALELEPGAGVITSPNTFLASANSIVYAGCRPGFADIDPRTGNMDPAQLKQAVNSETRAVIAVHYAGQSCDMKELRNIADARNLKIIEDAAHAIGSDYRSDKVGSCRYSEMTTFSFHPVKNMTTGEGGAIMTNDSALWERLRELRSHGMTRDPHKLTRNDGPWYYQMRTLGFNYRLTDIQAALGISQLAKMDRFKQCRRHLIARYRELLRDVDELRMLEERSGSEACFHLCPVLIDFTRAGLDKRVFFERMRKCGVNLQVHYIPVHTQPFYQQLGFRPGDFPAAEEFYAREFSLPLHCNLNDDDIDHVVECVKKCIKSD